MTLLRVLLLIAGIGWMQQPARDASLQPHPGTATISGMVVSDEPTPQPIRRARVVLNGDAAIDSQTATSDDSGRYLFRVVAAGHYTLQAFKPPFLPAFYGAKRPERPGTSLAVMDGRTISDLTIRMSRGAAIEGRVVDSAGAPMGGASVSVLRFMYSPLSGERSLTSPNTGRTTDDRGVYRAFGLPPGDYIVMANPPSLPGLTQNDPGVRRLSAADVDRALASPMASGSAGAGAPTAPGTPTTWAPVYYPGTSDVTAARMLTLSVGEEQSGVDLTMKLVRSATVSGIVTGPEGAAIGSVQLSIARSSENARAGMSAGFATSARPGADGRYAIGNLSPGSYTITARTSGAGLRGSPPASSGAPFFWANVDVTIDSQDLDVPIALRPAIPVSGRVEVKTSVPGSRPDLSPYRVMLRPTDSGPNLSNAPGAQPDDKGALSFTTVSGGQYRILISGPSAGTSLSLLSATVRGREILDGPLDIRGGTPIDDLTVTLTDRPSEISGTLQDASGRPATDYFIVVFSAERAFWTPLSRRVSQTRPALDGTYRVRNLPAGAYYVAALTDLASGETSDPKFLESLVASASTVTVADGATTTQAFQIR